MSDPKEHDPLVAARAARGSVMATVHDQVEEVVEHLRQDVFRLIEESRRGIPAPAVSEPPETPGGPGDEDRHQPARIDAELRQAIAEIVRSEIATLDVAALVKAEIDTQLRAVTRMLQERLKAAAKPNLKKLAPILSRRRR